MKKKRAGYMKKKRAGDGCNPWRKPATIADVGLDNEYRTNLIIFNVMEPRDGKVRKIWKYSYTQSISGPRHVRGTNINNEWQKEICRLFDVKKIDDIVGKKCFVLYSFTAMHSMIEGFETLDGKVYTTRDHYVKVYPDHEHVTAYKSECDRVDSDISHAKEQLRRLPFKIEELENKKRNLKVDYVEWKAKG